MHGCSQALYIRGRYQVVALRSDTQTDSPDPTGFAVVTSAGDRVRYEPSLDGARAWLDALVDERAIRDPVRDPMPDPKPDPMPELRSRSGAERRRR